MIQVANLTQEQKNELVGNQYTTDSYFNPIEDADGNWIISIEEIEGCDISAFVWVKDLPLINWNPPIYDDIY